MNTANSRLFKCTSQRQTRSRH